MNIPEYMLRSWMEALDSDGWAVPAATAQEISDDIREYLES